MSIEQIRAEIIMLNAEYKVYLEKRNNARDSTMWAAYQAKLEQIDKQIEVLANAISSS